MENKQLSTPANSPLTISKTLETPFVTALNSGNLINITLEENQLSFPRVLDCPALSKWGNEDSMELLAAMLMRTVNFFKVKNKMNTTDAIEAAAIIKTQFHFLSMDAIAHFLRLVKTGHYGEDFGRMDGPTLLKWLHQYVMDLNRARVKKERQLEAQKLEADIKKALGPKDLLPAETQKEIDRRKAFAKPEAITEIMNRYNLHSK